MFKRNKGKGITKKVKGRTKRLLQTESFHFEFSGHCLGVLSSVCEHNCPASFIELTSVLLSLRSNPHLKVKSCSKFSSYCDIKVSKSLINFPINGMQTLHLRTTVRSNRLMFLIYVTVQILERATVRFTKNIFHIEFPKGSAEEKFSADQIFLNNFFEGTLK